MAGRPIEIIVTSDTSGVEDGSKRIADSLENVQDALTDVESAAKDTGDSLGESLGDGAKDAARDAESALGNVEDSLRTVGKKADDAGDKLKDSLGDGVKDGARDASRSLEGVEDSLGEVSDKGKDLDRDLTQALKSIDDNGSKAGKGLGDSMSKGTDKAKEGLGEFKDEANSTAKESAASFDGSADSIVDSFQEIAANAFTGFGPAGAAAGLAIALTIGAAISKLQSQAEDNNAAKEAIGELGQAFIDAGGRIDDAALNEKVKELMTSLAEEDVWYKWGDQAQTGFEKVKEGLQGISDVDMETVFKGLAGDSEAAEEALEGLNKAIDEDNKLLSDSSYAMSAQGQATQDSKKKTVELRDELEKSLEGSRAAAELADAHADSEAGRAEAIERTNEAQRTMAEANMSVAETQIALAEGSAELTASLAENGATMDVNTEAGRNNQSALIDQIDVINQMAQAEVDAGGSVTGATGNLMAQRDALVNAVAPAFGGSKEAARQYIDKMLQIPKSVNTDVNLDGIPDAQQRLNNFTSQRPTITVLAQASVDRQRAYNELYGAYGGHSFAVNITPRGGNQALP